MYPDWAQTSSQQVKKSVLWTFSLLSSRLRSWLWFKGWEKLSGLSLWQSLDMKTSLILLACLLATAVAQRGGGGRRGGGRGPGGRRPGGPPRATCTDGSRPTCSDGTEPERRRGEPPCPDGQPPLTCTDGNPPVDKDGDPFCAKEQRLCCDETVLPQVTVVQCYSSVTFFSSI